MSKPPEIKFKIDITDTNQLVGLAVNFRTAQRKLGHAARKDQKVAMERVARAGHFLDTWLREYITANNPDLSKMAAEAYAEDTAPPSKEEVMNLIKSQRKTFIEEQPEEIEVASVKYTVTLLKSGALRVQIPGEEKPEILYGD